MPMSVELAGCKSMNSMSAELIVVDPFGVKIALVVVAVTVW